MSLNVPRSIFIFLWLAFAAAVVGVSCGGSQNGSLVAPSAVSPGGSTLAPTDESTNATAGEPASADATATRISVLAVPTPSPGTNPGLWPAPPPAPNAPIAPIYWTPAGPDNEWMKLSLDPDPVPFSGVPVPVRGCQEPPLPHTWYYSQVFQNRGGTVFRLEERENYFDGFLVSRASVSIEIPANQIVSVSTRWCSISGEEHTAQTRWRAVGSNGRTEIFNGPIVVLQQNPHWVPPPVGAPASRPQRLRQGAIQAWGD
jgi:hypothetical protein